MRHDKDRLIDILEAIENIKKYASLGRERFDADELIQAWMVHKLQVIGEAAGKVSDQLREQHPEIPWQEIIAMRNILVHAYFTVDLDEVWAVIQNDLPDLESNIRSILQSETV